MKQQDAESKNVDEQLEPVADEAEEASDAGASVAGLQELRSRSFSTSLHSLRHGPDVNKELKWTCYLIFFENLDIS